MRHALLPFVALVLSGGPLALVEGCGSDDDTGSSSGTPLVDGGSTSDGSSSSSSGSSGTVTPGTEDAGALLPPGATCLVDVDAGRNIASSCQDNPKLPTCYQCLNTGSSGEVKGMCVYTCRIGQDDCPPGQTCTATDNTSRTSQQECRNALGGTQVGYCK